MPLMRVPHIRFRYMAHIVHMSIVCTHKVYYIISVPYGTRYGIPHGSPYGIPCGTPHGIRYGTPKVY